MTHNLPVIGRAHLAPAARTMAMGPPLFEMQAKWQVSRSFSESVFWPSAEVASRAGIQRDFTLNVV